MLFCFSKNIACVRVCVCVCSVYVDDNTVQAIKDRILHVTSIAIEILQSVQNNYIDNYQYLFTKPDELNKWLTQHTASLTTNMKGDKSKKTITAATILQTFETEIIKYNKIGDYVKMNGKSNWNAGLIQIECFKINELIISQAQELKNAVLSHISSQLMFYIYL